MGKAGLQRTSRQAWFIVATAKVKGESKICGGWNAQLLPAASPVKFLILVGAEGKAKPNKGACWKSGFACNPEPEKD